MGFGFGEERGMGQGKKGEVVVGGRCIRVLYTITIGK
jgi:hypothetical protein